MSLQGGCFSRQGNLPVVLEIASGENQERPRNDISFLVWLLDVIGISGWVVISSASEK